MYNTDNGSTVSFFPSTLLHELLELKIGETNTIRRVIKSYFRIKIVKF